MLGASAAAALDEARIVDVSCDGLRVTQRGLPPGLALEVGVVDAPTGAKLAEADVTSSAGGTIDVRLKARLRGVRQIVVEVERRSDHTEYGEVGADLPQPCSPTPVAPSPPQPVRPTAPPGSGPNATVPPPGAATSPTPHVAAPTDGTDTSRVPAVLIAAAGLVAAAGIALVARRRRA